MVNFYGLVEKVLISEATIAFLQNLEAFYHQKYDPTYTVLIPGSNPGFERLVENTIFTRGTQNAYLAPELRDHYHYIDYLCFVNETNKKRSTATTNKNIDIKDLATVTDIDKITQDYIQAASSSFVGNVGSMYPIITHYKPISYTVRSFHDKVVAALVSVGLAGKVALDNYINKGFTISEAINDVVNLRLQTTSQPRPKQSSRDVDEFIINYKNYLPGGGKTVPTKFDKYAEGYLSLAESIEKYATIKKITQDAVLKKTVKDVHSDSSLSGDLIKQLTALANFVPERPSLSDRIGQVADGLNQMFKGLSMGVPTVGQKR